MKYLLLIPCPFLGVLWGWFLFAAMPGVSVGIFFGFDAQNAYTDGAAPYAAAAGAIVLTAAVFAFLRWPPAPKCEGVR